MDRPASSIEPSELKEVARLVRQAASVIDHMLVLNTSIDIAATNAVAHYRTEARKAEAAAARLVAGASSFDSDRERAITTLSARVQELEAALAAQTREIEALRLLLWPKAT